MAIIAANFSKDAWTKRAVRVMVGPSSFIFLSFFASLLKY